MLHYFDKKRLSVAPVRLTGATDSFSCQHNSNADYSFFELLFQAPGK